MIRLNLRQASHLRTSLKGFMNTTCYRHYSASCIKLCATTENASVTDRKVVKVEKVLVYNGTYEAKLKRLRRISLFSSVVSSIGLPLVLLLDLTGSSIPYAGQMAISSTVIVVSISSTIFLNFLCKPYVTTLHKLVPYYGSKSNPEIAPEPVADEPVENVLLESTRLNIFGNPVTSHFYTKEVTFIPKSMHPFATFKIGKNDIYYTYGDNFSDEKLKNYFTRK